MSKQTPHKKPAQKTDWHPADVVAALRKAGWSLRKLSAANGYAPTSAKEALHRPWPKVERLIAEAIGVEPETIWPARYDPQTRPRRGVGGHYCHKKACAQENPLNDTTGNGERNVKVEEAA